MITVTYTDETFECFKAVKGSDYIKLYDENDNLIVSFLDISDFSGYSIEGGDWSDPEPTEVDLLKEQLRLTQVQLELTEEALDTLIMGGV